jgi:ribosome modulation factor
MNWIKRTIGRITGRAPAPAPPTDLKPTFARQMAWESEGMAAGFGGKSSEDCPYDAGTSAASHWLYGLMKATSPIMLNTNGDPILVSTSHDVQLPENYLLKYPDGRITTKDGKLIGKSS